MDTLLEVNNVSVSIARPPEEVYSFITNGSNLSRWASGLGSSVKRSGDDWVAEGPLGKVSVRFVAPNELGVADHDVVLETGVTVRNPIRVVANNGGSTVVFTLLRQPGVSAKEFANDASTVQHDLTTLKALLEQPRR